MLTPSGPGNPRFFRATGPHTLTEIAAACGCEAPDRDISIEGLAPIEDASPGQISFAGETRHAPLLAHTKASAVIVPKTLVGRVPSGSIALISPSPFESWARVAALFHPPHPLRPGIHPSACVADDAIIDPSVEVGPHSVVGSRAEIGRDCRIGAGAIIGDGVVMGAGCRIGERVVISHALLGDRVRIFPGACIGQDGFGFHMGESGFITLPQLGAVILEDDVEVGANSTIDRGALRDTVVGRGTRIDNLVQIAHNVRLGRYCALASQTGIAGSTEAGDYVVFGGQAGITPHRKIGTRAMVAAQAGVMVDIEPGMAVMGSPAQPIKAELREIAAVRKMVRRRTSEKD